MQILPTVDNFPGREWVIRPDRAAGPICEGMNPSSQPVDAEHTDAGAPDLVFLLGAFRSGTTLLRKMLDSHPLVFSPAETWFLLPLVNLWEGAGTCGRFNPQQAAAALRGLASQEQFVACCRAFAEAFYRQTLPPGKSVYVDKTPMYLNIAQALPAMFPRARFIVLARDPRGILWSRHTWRHAADAPIAGRVKEVAGDVRRLASFWAAHRERSVLVRYEELCVEPEPALRQICAHMGVPFEPGMVAYGQVSHHEGYGDENTRGHDRPHAESVSRWGPELTPTMERELLELCSAEALAALGYEQASRAAA